MKKVFLGVGHGGKDPGAVANGFHESKLNLQIALACQKFLAEYGVLAAVSRETDVSEGLAERIKECNNFAPALAVDIHNNAGGGNGAEVYHHHKGGEGKVLAENILKEIVKIGQNSRGTKTKINAKGNDYYGWIRETSAPAVIVECAFLDNKADIEILDTLEKQNRMGEAIARGILETLGIKTAATPKPVKYSVQVGSFLQKQNAIQMVTRLNIAGFNDAFIVENE